MMGLSALLLGTALASPTVEVGPTRLAGWRPVYTSNQTLSDAVVAKTDPFWMGSSARVVFDLPQPVRRLYTSVDTHHWKQTWAHEPHDFVPRVHHLSMEVGLIRDRARDEGRHAQLRWSYGAGPDHQRFVRDGQRTLRAWGGHYSAGPGLALRSGSGWGATFDARFTHRIGNRQVEADVLSVGGDYTWTWHSGYMGLELRLALLAPLTRSAG